MVYARISETKNYKSYQGATVTIVLQKDGRLVVETMDSVSPALLTWTHLNSPFRIEEGATFEAWQICVDYYDDLKFFISSCFDPERYFAFGYAKSIRPAFIHYVCKDDSWSELFTIYSPTNVTPDTPIKTDLRILIHNDANQKTIPAKLTKQITLLDFIRCLYVGPPTTEALATPDLVFRKDGAYYKDNRIDQLFPMLLQEMDVDNVTLIDIFNIIEQDKEFMSFIKHYLNINNIDDIHQKAKQHPLSTFSSWSEGNKFQLVQVLLHKKMNLAAKQFKSQIELRVCDQFGNNYLFNKYPLNAFSLLPIKFTKKCSVKITGKSKDYASNLTLLEVVSTIYNTLTIKEEPQKNTDGFLLNSQNHAWN